MDKEEIISKIYNDPAGFGSIKETLKDARKKNPSITYADVKNWIDKTVQKKTQLKGYNSFIAHESQEEYQIDLFFINKKDFQKRSS